MRTSSAFGKVLVCLAGLGGVLALSNEAHAEARTHDGFYLSFNAGLGYLSSSTDPDVHYSGASLPSALWLGGTVGPVVIGGGFFGDYAFAPGVTAGGQDVPFDDFSMTLISFGAFADIYPDVHGGFHVMPYLGWGGLESSSNGNSGGSDPTGLVMAVGVGYDWFVAPEWSLGVMGRFAYAPLKMNDRTYSTIAPAVLFTVTYH
jgi:hypothetical protein